jgi:hypothetical protein
MPNHSPEFARQPDETTRLIYEIASTMSAEGQQWAEVPPAQTGVEIHPELARSLQVTMATGDEGQVEPTRLIIYPGVVDEPSPTIYALAASQEVLAQDFLAASAELGRLKQRHWPQRNQNDMDAAEQRVRELLDRMNVYGEVARAAARNSIALGFTDQRVENITVEGPAAAIVYDGIVKGQQLRIAQGLSSEQPRNKDE